MIFAPWNTRPQWNRAKKSDLLYEILQHQGRNAKQNNVTLEESRIEP